MEKLSGLVSAESFALFQTEFIDFVRGHQSLIFSHQLDPNPPALTSLNAH